MSKEKFGVEGTGQEQKKSRSMWGAVNAFMNNKDINPANLQTTLNSDGEVPEQADDHPIDEEYQEMSDNDKGA